MLYKTIVFAALLSATSLLQAQISDMTAFDWRIGIVNRQPIEYKPAKNVKEATFTVTEHHKTKVYNKTYNDAGMLVSYSEVDKNGTLLPIWKFDYNSDNKLIKAESFKKGELKDRTVFEFNSAGHLTRQEKTDAANQVLYKSVWSYDAAGCYKENIVYQKGGAAIKTRLVNEYVDSCQLSKSTRYNAKGKVVDVHTYDCNREGEKLEKKKNETQVCKWEKIDENILTKTYQSFDEDGKTMKNVIKYVLPDTLMIGWTKYDDENRIKFSYTYDKSMDKPLSFRWYRKGTLLSETKYEYRGELITSKAFILKGKVKQKTVYTYNADDLLAELKTFKKGEDVVEVATMDYVK